MTERRYVRILCLLIAAAAATRAALAYGSPRPFGYVWDLYHESVVWTYVHGRLPLPSDCGECYHPPLFLACGVPLYALGASGGSAAAGLRLLCLFSMACAGVVVYYCHRTLKLLRFSRENLLLGTAFALVFPCLFIASYGVENDVLLAALMSAFFYRLCRRHLHPGGSGVREPMVLGLLAGLSALTKYSGFLTVLAAGIVMSPRILFGRRRARAARELAIVVLTAASVCGWHYARNVRLLGKPFLGPPWAPNVFAVGAGKVELNRRRYDFRSFKIKEVVDLYRPGSGKTLNDFPVYDSVFTTLHTLAWTDMSFFSAPGRHGWTLPAHYAEGGADIPMVAQTPAGAPRVPVYPAKSVRLWLIELVLLLGIVPALLALAGFAATFLRRSFRPFVVLTSVSSAVYFWWVLAQDSWALKTKYLLFLLPVYVVYALAGLGAARRFDRRLGFAAAAGLIAALLAAEAYLWMFALG
jgi:hypothetical protein